MAKKTNKTGKAIIWGRVSTTQGELEEQIAELENMAIADGYKKSNLLTIKGKGASARKMDDLYKQEVNELLSTLREVPEVDCVYVWEVSRIARVEVPFYKMKDYFIKNKIQFIVKTPEIHLLKKDGELDTSQEVILNLMMTLAKQEMDIKLKRMARGKKKTQEKGKWGGGHLVYGYAVDGDNNIIVNEEEVKVVREIFRLYLEEDMSATAIFKYLNDRGYFNSNMLKASKVYKITSILRNRVYSGEYVNNKYPAIITKEQSDAAIAKLDNRLHKNYNSKNIYYGKKLLKCSVCGSTLTPIRSHAQYVCRNHGHRLSVSINGADTAIWETAIILNNEYMNQKAMENNAIYTETIANNNISIQAAKKAIQDAQEKAERAANLYVEGIYTKAQLDAKNALFKEIIKKREEEVVKLENANAQLQALLNMDEDYIEGFGNIGFRTETIEDDATRKEIIDRVIERVDVVEIDKWTKELTIHNKMGLPPHITGIYTIITRGGKTIVQKDGLGAAIIRRNFKHY